MYLLSERGFRGQLQANHKEKKLDLQVSINIFIAQWDMTKLWHRWNPTKLSRKIKAVRQ